MSYGTYNSSNPFQPQLPSSPSSSRPQSSFSLSKGTLGEYSNNEVFGGSFVAQKSSNPYESVQIDNEDPVSAHTEEVVIDNNPFAGSSVGVYSSGYDELPDETNNEQEVPLTAESEEFRGVPAGAAAEGGNTYHIWQKEFYQSYFDVEAKDVGMRILHTITPWRLSFFNTISKKPDLYGPFWITATVSFIIAVTANLHSYFVLHSDNWVYDPTKMAAAPSVMFGYVIVIPFIFWIVFKYIEAPVKLIELFCLYGYSLILFVPSLILCIFVGAIIKFIGIIASASISGYFIVFNTFIPLKAKHLKRGMIVLLVMSAFHLGLTLTLLFYFYNGAVVK